MSNSSASSFEDDNETGISGLKSQRSIARVFPQIEDEGISLRRRSRGVLDKTMEIRLGIEAV